MTAKEALPVEIQDFLSDLEDLVTGLEALGILLAEIDSMIVKPNQLFQLLHPIVEQQRQVLQNINVFFNQAL
jgi:hypothetical protein